MTIGISGITSLGEVLTEIYTFEGNIQTINTPLTSSTSQFKIPIPVLGKKATIEIQGVFTGTAISQAAFVNSVRSWADAGTQAKRVYTDSFAATTSVYCDDFEYKRSTSNLNTTEYTIVMIVTYI